METVSIIVGYLVIVGLSVTVAAIAVVIAAHYVREVIDSRYEEAEKVALQEVSRRVFCDAAWFSEDPPTMFLLDEMGKGIITHGGNDPSSLRERWREMRKSLKEVAS